VGLRAFFQGLLLLLAGCGQAAAMPMSMDAFSDVFVARAEREIPGVTFRVKDAATVIMIKPGEADRLVSLETIYQYYRNEPERCDELIGRLIATLLEDHDALLSDPARLVVIVRSVDNRAPNGEPAKGIERPLAGDLVQILAIDSPASVRYAGREDLATVKLSEEEAWKLAADNTLRLMGELETGELEPDLLAATAESGLATSLLASAKICGERVGEGVTVLMVSRDMFIFAPPDKPKAVKAFWRFVRDAVSDDEAPSKVPLVCRGGVWTVATTPGV